MDQEGLLTAWPCLDTQSLHGPRGNGWVWPCATSTSSAEMGSVQVWPTGQGLLSLALDSSSWKSPICSHLKGIRKDHSEPVGVQSTTTLPPPAGCLHLPLEGSPALASLAGLVSSCRGRRGRSSWSHGAAPLALFLVPPLTLVSMENKQKA